MNIEEAIRRAIALADSLGGDDADTIMALVETFAGQEWKDISSAPRNGEAFLGYNDGRPWLDRPASQPRHFLITGLHMAYATHTTWNGQSGSYGIVLTHWMPLPKPPHQPQ